ncbi:MAG: hypothetical protein HY906_17390 [Deltaproteobacteria bacterium]|nr:hypothetical protein [Deltaproteobacteria bacterium]
MWRKMLHLVLGGVLLAGCFSNVSEDPAAPVGGTRDRLQRTLEVPLEPGSCRVVVTVDRQYQGEMRQRIDLPVLDGTVALRSRPDALVEIAELRVDLDDVTFDGSEFPPNGVHVTGITLALRDVGEAPAEWVEGDTKLRAEGVIDLLLDWAVVTGNRAALPLGTQQVEGVAVEVEVSTTDDGKALVKVHGRQHGEFVTATGLFSISELSLELRGVG